MSSTEPAADFVYTIQGILVHFPYKAYPSQMAMMDKVLAGLKRGQNCLLESPTGSGKSLALLCASLAWLQHEKELAEQEFNDEITTFARETEKCNSTCDGGCEENESFEDGNSSVVDLSGGQKDVIYLDDDNDDFVTIKKKTPLTKRNQVSKMSILLESSEDSSPSSQTNCKPPQQQEKQQQQPKKRVLPKIYFGTRTHKQIAQLIRELGKTSYADVKMDILGSRDHTCVHPHVSKSGNKNDLCQHLLDPKKGEGCGYFTGASKVYSYQTVRNQGLRTAWDLEDLVRVGKKSRMCPYYLTRTLKDLSDIVFCPYNYIIDPLIRASMEINLNKNVLIFDEAHNMEDSARSAASFSVSDAQLKAAMADMDNVAINGYLPSTHNALSAKLGQLMDWILKQDAMLTGSEDVNKSWTGTNFVAVLDHLGLGSKDFDEFTKMVHEVRGIDLDPKMKDEIPAQLNSTTSMLLAGFTVILRYLYNNEFLFIDDYRIVVSKSYTDIPESPTPGVWVSKSKRNKGWVFTLKFWCLNPAVAMSDFQDDIRSLVLTSGTLSPMDTFESELNVPFKIKFEANHVIHSSQVWIGAVAQSDDVTLNGCFRNTESFEYQDAVGNLILHVCRVTPHGVLCFFPSYKLLEKLSTRWQDTGVWERIAQFKAVLSEPRNNLNNEFEDTLKEFYSAINQADEQVTGALLLAVCRGKVSEGLDFSDNNARAVITIGIPFSNVGAIDINLKRNYNDAHRQRRSRNLLSGGQWYEIQAFRALNQALGRCIRHRNDWGALILVDDRFGKKGRYIDGLSKWIRKGIKFFTQGKEAVSSLETFMSHRKETRILTDVSTNNSSIVDTPKRHLPESLKCHISSQTPSSLQHIPSKSSPLIPSTQTPQQNIFDLKKMKNSAATKQIKLPMFFSSQTTTSDKKSSQSGGSVLKRSLFKRDNKEEKIETEIRDDLSPILFNDGDNFSFNQSGNDASMGTKRKGSEENCDGQLKKMQRSESIGDLSEMKIICVKCKMQILDGECIQLHAKGPLALEPYIKSESSYLMTTSEVISTTPLNTSGQLLNAVFSNDDGCCFQVLACSGCQQMNAFKVVCTVFNSPFAAGQVRRECKELKADYRRRFRRVMYYRVKLQRACSLQGNSRNHFVHADTKLNPKVTTETILQVMTPFNLVRSDVLNQ